MSQIWNHVNLKNPQPEIGMGCTIFHYTDRTPATVVRVSPSGKTIWIVRDRYERADNNGMSECQQYTYTPGKGKEEAVRLCKAGQWKLKGERVGLGRREKYHDFSF